MRTKITTIVFLAFLSFDQPLPAADVQKSEELAEVIVTAQKRVERMQDVPVPVTAIDADALVNDHQLRLQDYYARIPGLTLNTGNSTAAPLLAIRGITSGSGTNPTVGVVVDDVPYGTSLNFGGGLPDLDPSELDRIEVLRGPQGTLYGANSIGGLLKFVTTDPSFSAVSGRIQLGTSGVHNGDGAGYNLRGEINLPLGAQWAVRASAFSRRDPGFVDDAVLGIQGVNETNVKGGRLSALWRPSETTSLKLTALVQKNERDGSPNVMPGLGDLKNSFLRNSGGLTQRPQAYSATFNTKLGRADLTSVTGYNVSRGKVSVDYSPAYGEIYVLPRYGVTGTDDIVNTETKKFSQEIRLSLPLTERIDWLLGGFYTHEDDRNSGHLYAVDPATGERVADYWKFLIPIKYSERAAFTNLTFRLTDRWDVQVGGRASRIIHVDEESPSSGPFNLDIGLPDPDTSPRAQSKATAFTYLVTPRFKLSTDWMLYARIASGYRPGGANTNVASTVAREFKPDKTENYEIGVKGSAFDRRLSLDASAYYIDWKDIQLFLLDELFNAYESNAARARSRGVELALSARPLTGLTIATQMVWNDAELTEAIPSNAFAYGLPGDRLPYSSRVSGSLSVDDEFPLANGLSGFVGASATYVGDRKGGFATAFVTPPQRMTFPGYAQFDARAGVRYESWMANFFVANIADKRGLLGGGLGTLYPNAFGYTRPRTVGLEVSRTF